MSRENVNLVRRTYETFVACHEPPWELFTDDAKMDATGASPDILVIRSRPEAQAALHAYAETFERYHVELEEVIHADEERVVTAVRDGGRVKGSDAELWNRFFHVFTFRRGKIAGWSTHTDRQTALDAAGLKRDNLGVIRGLHEALCHNDLHATLERLDPAVEWHENPRVGFADLSPLYRGHDEFRTWWAQVQEVWDVIQAEVEELTEVGSDYVLCAYKLHGRVRGSQVVSPTIYDLFTMRAGKIVERRLYPSRERALEASS